MIPADLLDKLRETDEELFLKVIGGFPLKNGKYLSILDMKPPAAHAWLQHCLQDAIWARGWPFTMTFNPPCGPEVPYYDVCMWYNSQNMIHIKADTEAEALLRAYLAAIQEAT